MKNIFTLSTLLFIVLTDNSFGQTATYTVASTSAVTLSGTAPSGSTATYAQTFGTISQITSGNSATLTLSGYAGYKITSIVLNMKSNTSAGAGTLSVVAGSTTIASISPTQTFANAAWNGAYSTTYVNITKTPSVYAIGAGENVVITIAATTNSLYINSYSITYVSTGNTVTFNANGGTGTMSNQTASTATALTANAFTRTGYTFAGWNTVANGSGTAYANSASYPFTANATLYAQWTANNNTITFNGNGSTGGSTATQTLATAATANLTANGYTRTGYTFASWNTAANGSGTTYANNASYTMGTANVTLYAQWTANNNTITFDGNGSTGGSTATQTLATAATANLNANGYTRTGYTFANWNTAANGSGTGYANSASYMMGTANVTLYAQWTANNNTITFDGNGSTGGFTTTQTLATAATANLNANGYTRTGYTFASWNSAANGSGSSYANSASYTMGTASLTLYAQWNINSYTVTFDGNTPTAGSPSTVSVSGNYNTNVTLATIGTLVKTGYTFSGWNTASDGSGTTYAAGLTTYTITATNITLYAKWDVTGSYTVTFDANGGTGTMANQTTNSATALTTNAFTRTGYTFAGWNTVAGGGGTAYADGASYAFSVNVTLYAQWTANNNSITFDGNGSTGGSTATQTLATAATANLTANGYTRTGYTFASWNTAANGSGTIYANSASYTMGTANVTLYAQWTANNNTITFDGNGSTGGSTTTQTLATAATANLTANGYTRTGYTFASWNTAANGSGTSYANSASYTMGTDSVTLYAQWTANNNTITFNGNGSTGGSTATQTLATASTANLTANGYTRTGYTFASWNTAANGSGTTYANSASYTMGTASVTLYAQWTANNNTITFNGNGSTGGSTATQTLATAATANLTTNGYTRTGYTFASWNTAANGSGTSYANSVSYTMGTGNVTLYAQWTANNNTITFDGNGFTGGSTSSQTLATAATANLTANGYTRTGYTFANWNTAANGSGTNYADGASYTMGTANVTLYAQWIVGPCLSQLNFTATPSGWAQTSITYAANEANFASNNGELTTIAVANPSSLTFDLRRTNNASAKTLYVEVSTTTQGGTYTMVATYDHSNTTSAATTSLTVDLSAYTAYSTVYIKFRKASSTTSPWYLKNVQVTCGVACTPPTTQTTVFTSSGITVNSATVGWTRGNGDSVFVVARAGGAVTSDPLSGTSYAANAVYSSGAQIGTGNYVVYKGTGTSVNITGLSSNTAYYFAIYEFKSTGICYDVPALTGNFTTLTPTITLSSSNPAVSVANIMQGTTNNVIYMFSLSTVGNATLTGVTINTTGTYVAANISNFKCWYSSDAVFSSGTDVLLSTKSSTLGAGAQVFPSFASQDIANGASGTFFITTDLPCASTVGNTVIVSAITTTDLTFSSGTKTGTASVGGTQTINLATPNNVTAQTTSACSNGGTTVGWTMPTGCYDATTGIFVFANAGSFSATLPTGNGGSYSANLAFGSGTAFDGGFCVYKGVGTSINVTGLTNGTNYTYKIFTRNGTAWTSGVTTSCTPSIVYCTAASTDASFEFIQGVTFNTISNATAATNYTDYSGSPTTVEKGATYALTIFNGDYYSTDIALVWADWNGDGDFADVGEDIFASNSGDPAPYFANITIPATAITGTVGMRIRLYDSGAGTSNSTPCGTHTYGEVEDYALNIVVPCTPTHAIASVTPFTPTRGPVGTSVTINGTGFSPSSTVSFNGVASTSVRFINSTKLIAVVPTGATTGKIQVNEGSCYVRTTTDFVMFATSGSCTANASFSDLIISEVYDVTANNVCYIELYNPTSAAINLGTSNYTIKIDNNTAATPVTIDRTITLSGTIAAGGVFLLNLGTSANTCTKTWDFTSGGSGINASDNIFLAKNGTNVDRVNAPSNDGYTILRKATAVGPTATFNSSDWTTFSTEDCSDLGYAPVTTYPNPTVAITNTTACNINLSVAVTEGNASTAGDVTFNWYYNNGTATGWTQVNASTPSGYTISGHTTTNLQISDNSSLVTALDDYQFYCEATEATTCKNVSSATKFGFNTRPVYRSITSANGNWTTISNWEMASTTSGPWISACTYPKSSNSSQVIIQSGSYVILDVDNDVDKLTVDANATLEIGYNSQMTVYDSTAGADFFLNGTLYYRSNSANSFTFDDPAGAAQATWIFGSGATIIKSASGSADNFRVYYEGGMSTIPSTGKWIYRYNGDGNPLTSAAGFYYPDLYFENAANTNLFDFNSTTMQLSGNSTGLCTVKGNMYVGTTGTGTVKIYNNNINPSPMLITGNLTIGTGSTFTNSLCSTCGTPSTSSDNGIGLELKGSLINNGVLDNNSSSVGILKFSGTGTQTLSGTGSFDIWNMELNKTSTTLVDQQVNLETKNNLNFVGGVLKTGTNEMYISNSSINAITGANTAGIDKYVQGRLKRKTDGSSTYAFPVGHGSQYAQGFSITPTGTNGSLILGYLETNNTNPTQTIAYCDLETYPGGGTVVNVGGGSPGYDGHLDKVTFNLASPLQWDITNPGGGVSSYNLTVLANGGQDITPVVSANGLPIRYLMKNGEPGNPGVATGTGGGSFPQVGFIACPNGYALTALTSFSKFTLNGANGSGTVLPVSLLYFTAEKVANYSQLNWATSLEINNDKFIVERSIDALNFEPINEVKGAGTTTQTQTYALKDASPVLGWNYYRLKQVDFDGAYEYSNMAAVYFDGESSTKDLIIFPNPAQKELFLIGDVSETTSVTVVDALGKTCAVDVVAGKGNAQVNVANLASGMYILTVKQSGTITYHRFQKMD